MTLLLVFSSFLMLVYKLQKSLQAFQMNSYRYDRYLRYLKSEDHVLFEYYDLYYLIGALGILLLRTTWVQIVFAAPVVLAYYLTIRITRREEIKKPLVYTDRVKRLMATSGVLVALLAIASVRLPGLALPFYIFPFLVLYPAAWINHPMEAAIKGYYHRDAQKELEAVKGLTVIGLTGSYGKTSTKDILHAMLSTTFNTLKTPESYNTKMGLTLTLRRDLRPYHTFFIAEMGAKEVGDIAELVRFVSPHAALITSIGRMHLDTFGSEENIKKTKLELFTTDGKQRLKFINCYDETLAAFTPEGPAITIGPGGDFELLDDRIEDNRAVFDVRLRGEVVTFTTRLLGRHNLYNIVNALAIAHTYGVPTARLKAAVRSLEPTPHRLSYSDMKTYTLLDDAFNANEIGFTNALEVLGQMPGGEKYLITPGIIELGEAHEAVHRRLAVKAAEACDRIYLVGENRTAVFREALLENGFPQDHLMVFGRFSDAFAVFRSKHKAGDVLLIENDLPDIYNE